jgi:hypothetical protein
MIDNTFLFVYVVSDATRNSHVFNDYSGVEFNLPNYQKYTIKVLGVILLLMKLSSLIKGGGKTIFRGGGGIPPCTPLKKPWYYEKQCS